MSASFPPGPRRPSRSHFCGDDLEAAKLADRLRDFYASTRDYGAFHAPSSQTLLWFYLAAELRARLPETPNGKIHVLEVGAGRSGLGRYLESVGLRDGVELHAQDVTPQNVKWLQEHFDFVSVGPIDEVQRGFDFVLGSYVLEHVTDPRAFLDALWDKLTPGGAIMMTCPRYDAPFYLPPSVDHLSATEKLTLACKVIWRRLVTLATRRPAWLVLRDPAVFHLPFSIDRDAVHWVSWFDVRAHWPQATRLKLASGSISDWIAKNLLSIGFRVVKERPSLPQASGDSVAS